MLKEKHIREVQSGEGRKQETPQTDRDWVNGDAKDSKKEKRKRNKVQSRKAGSEIK